jgi:hypothetical protein
MSTSMSAAGVATETGPIGVPGWISISMARAAVIAPTGARGSTLTAGADPAEGTLT